MRDRILEAATELFARNGYGSTSMREVAERAGCTKPALYYHFENKEELFREVVRANILAFADIIEAARARPGTVRERIEWFVAAFLDRVRAEPHRMRLLVKAQHPVEDGQPEIDVMELHRKNGQMLVRLLEEGVRAGEVRGDVPLEDMTLALVGMMNIRALQLVHRRGRGTAAEAARRVVHLFFEGVRPREVPR